MVEEVKSSKTAIIVAIISLIGVIATAMIANYDKLIPPSNTAANTNTRPSEHPQTAAVNEPVRMPRQTFLGALDGIYISHKKDELTFNWANRSFSLLHFNCEILGNIVEGEADWKIMVVNTDGMCSLIDDDDIGKEVGTITPEKGSLSNSGRVGRALVNFQKASLSPLSGVYEFKYNTIEEMRRDR